jgi:hypothetical protein
MTVDTEEEWDWAAGWPVRGYSLENIRNLPRFQQLCSRHGIAPTYFVNRAVLDDDDARRTLFSLGDGGRHEIGMHIHPWNTPPVVNEGPVGARETFLHNLDEQLILAKLAAVYDRFRDFGLKPTSFRGGRYSSGGTIHRFLQDNGFLADSSVVPFVTWDDPGAPDYRHRDLAPVRLPPIHTNSSPLWEIPLTLGFTRRPYHMWAAWYELSARSWLRKLRLVGIGDRLGIVRKVWLNFEDTPAPKLLSFLTILRKMQLPCICLTVHSSSLMAGKSGYTPTTDDERRLFDSFELVFSTLKSWSDFQPATMSNVAIQLEHDYSARSRN